MKNKQNEGVEGDRATGKCLGKKGSKWIMFLTKRSMWSIILVITDNQKKTPTHQISCMRKRQSTDKTYQKPLSGLTAVT